MRHMSASDLIQGKIYKIRRVQPAYNGRKGKLYIPKESLLE